MSETRQDVAISNATAPASAKAEGESLSFLGQLDKNRPDYITLLGSERMADRFIQVTKTAVKQNPALLSCTPRSLFNALAKAAQDGLYPDGREGVITSYRTNTARRGEPDRWELVASWSPMVYGIRKRAREIDEIIIDAQVVWKNDKFTREQGDDPKIIHTPTPLDEDPGALIGCYAIFRKGDEILHREVMRQAEVMAVKEQSKAKGSLMWTKFETEGWKKSVIRRGSKAVPVSEALTDLITRDDEHFDFAGHDQRQHAPAVPAVPPPPPPPPGPPPPPQVTQQPEPPKVPEAKPQPEKETVAAGEKPKRPSRAKKPAPAQEQPQAQEQPAQAGQVGEIPAFLRRDPPAPQAEPEGDPRPEPPLEGEEEGRPGYPAFLDGCYEELAMCLNEKAVEELRDRVASQLSPEDAKEFKIACADKATDIFNANKKF